MSITDKTEDLTNDLSIQIPVNSIQAWFFDLDGTLMDTDDQAVETLARRMRLIGSTASKRLARFVIMKSETPLNIAVTLVDILGLDSFLFKLRKRLSRHQLKPTYRIIDGVKEMLEKLSIRATLGVVSTRNHEDAVAFLEQHGLADMFSIVVTQESTRRLKPHPDPVIYAANKLDLPLEKCVMVGDTTVDIRSGRRAGAWAIAVLCGFGECSELQRAGAHLVLPSTRNILDYL
jgi:HAD superfamily hydrolase (TIGR01509 family)